MEDDEEREWKGDGIARLVSALRIGGKEYQLTTLLVDIIHERDLEHQTTILEIRARADARVKAAEDKVAGLQKDIQDLIYVNSERMREEIDGLPGRDKVEGNDKKDGVGMTVEIKEK